jgi:hypothetical protein
MSYYKEREMKSKQWKKEGNAAVNLSINRSITAAAQAFIRENRRKGRRSLSQMTENLWISYLRSQGVKLPPLFKDGR